MEAWHNAINGAMRIKHPTIWSYIDFIKKEQGQVEAKMVQVEAGSQPATKRRVYRESDARLKLIVESFEENRNDPDYLIDYLKAIAHNITIYFI